MSHFLKKIIRSPIKIILVSSAFYTVFGSIISITCRLNGTFSLDSSSNCALFYPLLMGGMQIAMMFSAIVALISFFLGCLRIVIYLLRKDKRHSEYLSYSRSLVLQGILGIILVYLLFFLFGFLGALLIYSDPQFQTIQ